MNEGDLNAHPESFDEGWHPRDRNSGGISAGKLVNWLVLILVLVAVGYLAYGAVTAFFPRWWAEQVGDEVQGSYTQGSIYGLVVGSVFTFLPLLLLAQVRRRFFSWTWRFIVMLLALVLAMPNWLTVAVAVGTSMASQDGRIIMTTEGPGFRNGSAIGAVIGLVLGLIVITTSMRLGHQRKKVRQLKAKVSALEKRVVADAPSEPVDDEPASAEAETKPKLVEQPAQTD